MESNTEDMLEVTTDVNFDGFGFSTPAMELFDIFTTPQPFGGFSFTTASALLDFINDATTDGFVFFDGLGTTEGLDFSLDAIQTTSSLLDFDSLVQTTVDPFIQTTADPFGFDLFPASTES